MHLTPSRLQSRPLYALECPPRLLAPVDTICPQVSWSKAPEALPVWHLEKDSGKLSSQLRVLQGCCLRSADSLSWRSYPSVLPGFADLTELYTRACTGSSISSICLHALLPQLWLPQQRLQGISQCCRAVQVLTLAASISPGILKRGVTPQSVQEEVQHVLELQQYDAAGQQDTGSYQPFCMGPSALGVDDAISALQESVDWMRMRSYALPGGADSPAQMPYVNDRFESHACLLSKNSHFHLGHFSACGQIGHY